MGARFLSAHPKGEAGLPALFRRRDADGCGRDRRHNTRAARFAGYRAPQEVANDWGETKNVTGMRVQFLLPDPHKM
jgi:hypothetical protein